MGDPPPPPRPSGLKPPSKIGRLCGSNPPKPSVPPSPKLDGAYSIRKLSDDLIKTRINEEDEEDIYTGYGRRMSYDRKSSIGGLSSNDSLWGDARRLSEAGIRRTSDQSVVLTEDTDSFIIGDRVWVGGTKPGHIAFIGETSFAPGEWAGIVLDEPVGKNDGSVGGKRYFQCENKKGVFSKLTRLTRYPMLSPLPTPSPTPPTPPPTVSSPTSSVKSSSSILKTPSLVSPTSPVPSGEVRIGERVIVMCRDGSKAGVLRFKGPTQFAEGTWCGVELDDPLGKNDGSVEGIRYFTCESKYGLFTPASKVSRSPAPGRRPSCQIHHSTSSVRRASSKESINSIASSIRTNATSTSVRKPLFARPSALPSTPKPTSQELLKSKQEQIAQLLKERESDRSSMTKAAEQADEAERKLEILQREYETYRTDAMKKLDELKETVTILQKEKTDLSSQLEDVQFRAEEETFFKSDIQDANDKLKDKVKELINLVTEQKGRIEELSVESRMLKDSETTLQLVREELEHLKNEKDSKEKELKQELIDTIDRANRMEENYNESQEKLDNMLNTSTRGTSKQILEESNNSLKSLQNTIDDLKNQNKLLNTQLSEQDIFKNELVKSLESKENEHADLMKKIEDFKNYQTKYNEDKNSLLEKMENLVSNNEKIMKELNIKIEENNNLTITLESLKGDSGKFFKESDEKSKIIDKLKNDLNKSKQEADTIIKDLNERSRSERESYKKQMSEYDAQLRQSTEELTKLKLHHDENNEKIKLLNNEIHLLKESLNEKTNSNANKDTEILNLKNEKETFKTESEKIIKMKECLDIKNNEINKLSGTITELKKQLENIENIKLSLEKNKDENVQILENKIKDKTTEIDYLKSEIDSFTTKIKEKDSNIDELLKKLNQVEINIKNSQKELNSKTSDIEKLQNDLSVANEKVSNLTKNEENLRSSEQKLILELGGTQRRLENTEKRCKELVGHKEKLEKDMAELMNSSSDSSSQLTKLNNDLISAQKELETFKQTSSLTMLELKNKEQDLLLQLSASKEENEKLHQEYINNLNISKESVSQVESDYKNKISQLEIELKNSLTIVENDKKHKEDLNETIHKLEQSCKDAYVELKETKNSKQQLLKEFEAVNNKLKENEENDKIKTHKIDDLNKKLENLEITLTNLNDEKGVLDAKVTESEHKCNELVSNLNKINAENVLLLDQAKNLKITSESEILSFKTQIEDKDQLLVQNSSRIQDMDNQIKNIVSEMDMKNEAINKKQIEIESLKDTISSVQEENKKFEENNKKLRESKEELERINAALETKLSVTQGSSSELASHIQQFESQISELNESLKQSISKISDLETDLSNKNSIIDNLTKEKENNIKEYQENENNLKSQIISLEEALQTSKLENGQKSSEENQHKKQLESSISELENKLQLMLEKSKNDENIWSEKNNQIEILNSELNSKLLNIEKKSIENLSILNVQMEALTKETTENIQIISDLKQSNDTLENKVLILNKELEELRDQKNNRGAQYHDLKTTFDQLKQDKESINKELQESKDLLIKMTSELDIIKKKEADKLTQNQNNLINLESQLKSLESSKAMLQVQLNQALNDIKLLKNQNGNDIKNNTDETNSWFEEKELAESQINFLNSIIVDMKKKNEALSLRLEAVEMGETYQTTKQKKEAAPRLFCDICDIFDAHDTEDCPRQATESPPPVQRHKSMPRNTVRPYCENCEMFGHDTADCDDGETF